MNTETTIHYVPIDDFIRLQGAMDKLKLWTLSNGGCYYSCKIKITDDFEITLFTNDRDAQHPDLNPTEVLDASR